MICVEMKAGWRVGGGIQQFAYEIRMFLNKKFT